MDIELRTRVANAALAALMQRVPGSIAELRGSLAHGKADRYSDIDVLWEVPDEWFGSAVSHIEDALGSVAPIESLRSDPDFQRSERRRLFYVRFEGLPLFWRLDLDVFARSIGRDDAYDRANPAAQGSTWSPTESALMNIVATVKAHYRQDGDKGRELLRRGYERVGLRPSRQLVLDQAVDLAEGIRAMDPTMHDLAERVLQLVAEAFATPDSGNDPCL